MSEGSIPSWSELQQLTELPVHQQFELDQIRRLVKGASREQLEEAVVAATKMAMHEGNLNKYLLRQGGDE